MTSLRFAETLATCRMDVLLKERGRVLVAYSGGADSSCLLLLMRDWCAENGVALSAAHVNHNEVQQIIRLSNFLCIALCNRFLIQRVEDTDTGKLRNTGDTSDIHQLVNNYRVNNVRGNADLICDLTGQDTAQVGGMLAAQCDLQVMYQCVCYCIGSAGDGL